MKRVHEHSSSLLTVVIGALLVASIVAACPTAPDAEILVSGAEGRIGRFDEATLSYLGDFGPSQLDVGGYEDIAFGPDGKLYVAEYYAGRVQRFLPDGSLDSGYSCPVPFPYRLAFDPAGTLYVTADIGEFNRELYRCAYDGTSLGIFGSGLSAARYGPDGYFYFSDSRGSRVMRFRPDGSDISVVVDVPGHPDGLDFASNGDLYIALSTPSTEEAMHPIYRWNARDGLSYFTSVLGPSEIQFDQAGNLIVATHGYLAQFHRVRPDGSYETVQTANVQTFYVALTSSRLPAYTPPGTFAYVTTGANDTVHVVDTAKNTIATTVSLGKIGYGVATHPDGSRAYIGNIYDGTVSVIDAAANVVTATVAVGGGPFGIAVNPAGTRAYVTNRDSATVSVIDTIRNTVVATVPVGSSPAGLAVNPSADRVYVANQLSHSVTVIDALSNTVVKTVPVGSLPVGVTVHPSGAFVYVTNTTSGAPAGSVSVIDTSTDSVVTTIAVGGYPYAAALHPSGSILYVSNNATGNVSVIETIGHTVIATVSTLSEPAGVSVHPSGAYVYVAHQAQGNIAIIATATNTVTQTIPLSGPLIAFGPFIGPGIPTPAGQLVTVSPTPGSTVTFSHVPAPGTTTLTSAPQGPSLPAGLSLGDPPTYYDIATTATFTGPVEVCLTFDPARYTNPADLQLLHYENGSWVNVTTSSDTAAHRICGQVNSLSPFVVAQRSASRSLTAISPVHLWIGLKNSDDQGTQFDLKVELLKNGTPIASGLQRCITGVTRNPTQAKAAIVSVDPFGPVPLSAGDVLALRASTRIGTNANGSTCSGPGGSHNNATGLRVYYDSVSRAASLGTTTTSTPSDTLYLHSNGMACGSTESAGVTTRWLDTTPTNATSAKCKDSSSVNFAGGNAFAVIGTWSLAPQP